MVRLQQGQVIRAGMVAASLLLALIHSGPLHGSLIALLAVIAGQLILPGWLLARVLGKTAAGHPFVRLAWVLVSGLGVTVPLGAVMHALGLRVIVYLLALHAVMLMLALRPAPAPDDSARPWRFSRRMLPLYALVVAACLVSFGVTVERSRLRYNGFEDQTVFVSQANWIAGDPAEVRVYTRRANVPGGDLRLLTDGWTYTHAAWVWSSGVPAADLLWHLLGPIFGWTAPLVIFALAYAASGREDTAAFSAAAVVIAGLLTLDPLVYRENPLAFGQFALFELNTLRKFSAALMLPLALFATLSYLRAPRRRDLWIVLLAGIALASMHPQQMMIYLVSAGATLAVWWLAEPKRARLITALWLAGALLLAAALTVYQATQDPINNVQLSASVDESLRAAEAAPPPAVDESPPVEAGASDEAGVSNAAEGITATQQWILEGRVSLLVFDHVPLFDTTYIIDPARIFYHPVIALAALLGLLAGIGWRRSLAAQYVFASTAAALLLLFTPGLTPIFTRAVTFVAAQAVIFAVPIGLILGGGLAVLLDRVTRVERGRLWIGAGLLAALLLLLYVEPVPIPASGRDQINAVNRLQALRDILPADRALVDHLAEALPGDTQTVWLVNRRTAAHVIERVPGTLITSGRPYSVGYPGTQRFFLNGEADAPWLDDADLAFIIEMGTTHIVMEADDARLAPMLLQPERFSLRETFGGFLVFEVGAPLTADAADARFATMNDLFAETPSPRWDGRAFAPVFPGDPVWRDLADQWQTALAVDPGDDVARYGLAMCLTLAGDDDRALVLWQTLAADHPGVLLFREALAAALSETGAGEAAAAVLLDGLNADDAAARVLSARTLLTDRYFYLLDDADLDAVLAVAEAAPVLWQQLAVVDRFDAVRAEAALLLSAGRYQAAAAWLDRLPAAEHVPGDFVTRGLALLASGDVPAALGALRPAADADTIAPNVFVHPDVWAHNTAADVYAQLRAEVDGAAPAGAVPLLAVAEHGALHAFDPVALAQEGAVTVEAAWGAHPGAYPVTTWRLLVTSPDASTQYASAEIPAEFPDGPLTRAAITAALPEDVPPLTPARAFLQPLHNPAVSYPGVAVDVTLNRPGAAQLPEDAVQVDAQFGETITLRGYTLAVADGALTLTLYWEADSVPAADYQVFVHMVDDSGAMLAQDDSAPVGGRYPTGQWLPETLIADAHTLPAPDGAYTLRVGLYTLPDAVRLPVTLPVGSAFDAAPDFLPLR